LTGRLPVIAQIRAMVFLGVKGSGIMERPTA
jgi:hypothetical protein